MNKQKTLKEEIHIEGIGLHTGKKVKVVLKPLSEDKGIIFRRVDLANKPVIEAIPVNILQSDKRLQRTSITKEGVDIHTVEHLLAALSGFSVDNVLIDIDGTELPGLDGSIRNLAEILQKTGFSEQNAPKKFIEIKKPILCRLNDSTIEARPDSRFRIEYHLEFKQPWLTNQSFSISVDCSEEFNQFFVNELAPSRTFCFEEEAVALLRAGLGKGANFDNTLVMSQNGPIKNQLRFSDELARHKILDLLGDLYLLGGHIKGRIIAKKSGHQLNAIFVKKVAVDNGII